MGGGAVSESGHGGEVGRGAIFPVLGPHGSAGRSWPALPPKCPPWAPRGAVLDETQGRLVGRRPEGKQLAVTGRLNPRVWGRCCLEPGEDQSLGLDWLLPGGVIPSKAERGGPGSKPWWVSTLPRGPDSCPLGFLLSETDRCTGTDLQPAPEGPDS